MENVIYFVPTEPEKFADYLSDVLNKINNIRVIDYLRVEKEFDNEESRRLEAYKNSFYAKFLHGFLKRPLTEEKINSICWGRRREIYFYYKEKKKAAQALFEKDKRDFAAIINLIRSGSSVLVPISVARNAREILDIPEDR